MAKNVGTWRSDRDRGRESVPERPWQRDRGRENVSERTWQSDRGRDRGTLAG